MKITIENTIGSDIEIVIRGDATSERVQNIINILGKIGHDKIPKMILGRLKDKDFVLPIEEIEYFTSEGNGIIAYYQNTKYKVSLKLIEIEYLYKQLGFRRISKSIVLNCNCIHCLEIEFSGNYTITTKNGHHLTLSRNYVPIIKKYIKEEM